MLAMFGQIPVPGLVSQGDHYEDRLRCVQDGLKLVMESKSIDMVILHAYWSQYLKSTYEDKEFKDVAEREAYYARCVHDMIKSLLKAGKKVVLIYPIPVAGKNVPDFLARLLIAKNPLVESIPMPSFEEKNRFVMAAFEGLPQHPNLIRIRPHQHLMRGDRMLLMANGKPLYIDDNHLSVAGVEFIEDLLDQAFALPR